MPNELLLFTYHFPQISQQNQKTTSTKRRQDTFLKYRLGSIPRLPFGQKTSIKFSKFSARPKQNPVAIGDRASVISIPALQSSWSEDFDPPRIGPLVQICGGGSKSAVIPGCGMVTGEEKILSLQNIIFSLFHVA